MKKYDLKELKKTLKEIERLPEDKLFVYRNSNNIISTCLYNIRQVDDILILTIDFVEFKKYSDIWLKNYSSWVMFFNLFNEFLLSPDYLDINYAVIKIDKDKIRHCKPLKQFFDLIKQRNYHHPLLFEINKNQTHYYHFIALEEEKRIKNILGSSQGTQSLIYKI